MRKQTFGRVKKTLAVLLVALFLISVTVAAADASDGNTGKQSQDYKNGKIAGEQTGYKDGQKDKKTNNYKISYNDDPGSFTADYKAGYAVGYKEGYEYGFNTGTIDPVSYTHLRAHETDSYLVCRL